MSLSKLLSPFTGYERQQEIAARIALVQDLKMYRDIQPKMSEAQAAEAVQVLLPVFTDAPKENG